MTEGVRDVLTIADKYRRQLLAQDAAAIERLKRAYIGLHDRLQVYVEALADMLEQKGELTEAQLIRADRYKRLIREAQDELEKYGTYLEMDISQSARLALEMGEQHARGMVLAQIPAGVSAQMRALHPAALETLIGFLSPEGALFKKISEFAPYHIGRIIETITSFVGLGKNPRVLARELTRVFGYSLTDALRMSRTVQIYSYREANRASYIANGDVVEGWIWASVLDPGRTCMSCVAKHGGFHTNDERLNDHHNGLCFMLPQTILGLSAPVGSGEDWFSGLPRATQQDMMGYGKWQAWQAGKFEFSQLSRETDDDVYGKMWTETPLKDLVREKVEA